MKEIKIFDKTLSLIKDLSFKGKTEIAKELESLNVNGLEFDALSDKKEDLLLIKTVSSFVKNAKISIGVNSEETLKRAADSLAGIKNALLRIELPVSFVRIEYEFHKKPPKMLEYIKGLTLEAVKTGIEVEFCALDATRADKAFLLSLIEILKETGVKTLTLSDEEGKMLPDEFAAFVSSLSSCGIDLGVDLLSEDGLSLANAVTSLKEGVSVVKTAVKNHGTSTEAFSKIISEYGLSYEVKSNVKSTELKKIITSIDAILADKGNKKIKVDEKGGKKLKLTANDDIKTVKKAITYLGYELDEEEFEAVYEEFLRVASKKIVGNEELDAIVASAATQVPATFKLISFIINSGNTISASAQITLEKDGKTLQGVALGDGPIDAAFLTLEKIIGRKFELEDFQIQSVTSGKEAMGSAVVKLRSDGKLYAGNGLSTDIIGASIRAYISAVNKIVFEEK